MSEETITSIVDRVCRTLSDSQASGSAKVIGCSEDEIRLLEEGCDVVLPWAYQRFLRLMGRQPGDLLKGTDIGYERVFSLRESADLALARWKSPFRLRRDDFVFCGHEGYSFVFFSTMEGDNPPIYALNPQWLEPKRSFERFTDWLLDVVSAEYDLSV